MRIKKYTLKFIGGKDNKIYLRYFATIEKGVGKTYDKPIDAKLKKVSYENQGINCIDRCNSTNAWLLRKEIS